MVTTLPSVAPVVLQCMRSTAEESSGSEVICRQQQQQQRHHHADSSCVCYQTPLMPTHTTLNDQHKCKIVIKNTNTIEQRGNKHSMTDVKLLTARFLLVQEVYSASDVMDDNTV